ncbi:hypothetical protein IC619_011395 [Hazenella sp. IB182353]|uniref:hypothetical protein n=1 Tax=Polycladospora coralii TaxID=2771432 RepID=UPI00174711B8|nr:hypothetical protein [Polycladospora coralii]MBS7531099.1 hypothetical protein [Polycladospora coralii]
MFMKKIGILAVVSGFAVSAFTPSTASADGNGEWDRTQYSTFKSQSVNFNSTGGDIRYCVVSGAKNVTYKLYTSSGTHIARGDSVLDPGECETIRDVNKGDYYITKSGSGYTEMKWQD